VLGAEQIEDVIDCPVLDNDSPKSFSTYGFGTDIDEDYVDMETTCPGNAFSLPEKLHYCFIRVKSSSLLLRRILQGKGSQRTKKRK
jgi:hypothetical protein